MTRCRPIAPNRVGCRIFTPQYLRQHGNQTYASFHDEPQMLYLPAVRLSTFDERQCNLTLSCENVRLSLGVILSCLMDGTAVRMGIVICALTDSTIKVCDLNQAHTEHHKDGQKKDE